MSELGLGRVVSVNVGVPRVVEWAGRQVTTAIWKQPASGPVAVAGVNLRGDDQADRRVHGGPDKAVYAYAREDYRWWQHELGRAVDAATFGENLTTEGLDLARCVVGERWQVGTVVLRVTQPRFPCFKLGIRMGDAAFVDRFASARRNGAYLTIEQAGVIAAGDAVVVVERPADDFTIADFVAADEDGDRDRLERLATHPLVPASWRETARRRLARGDRHDTGDAPDDGPADTASS